MRLLLIICIIIALSACAGGGQPTTSPTKHTEYSNAYSKEWQKVRVMSLDSDFDALRVAYTDTNMYQPYFIHSVKPIYKALNKGNFEECAQLSEDYLLNNQINLGAHLAAMICYFELGKKEKGVFHRFVVDGLMRSIAGEGDGRSFETAHRVISTPELYSFLQILGLKVKSQSLMSHNGTPYDVMAVVNPRTGEEFALYFDISLQMEKGFKKIN